MTEHGLETTAKAYSSLQGVRGQMQALGKSGTRVLANAKSAGKVLGLAAVAVTLVDSGVNGFKNHHYADVAVGLGTTFLLTSPAGWAIGTTYFFVDMGVKAYSGKSITENLFD